MEDSKRAPANLKGTKARVNARENMQVTKKAASRTKNLKGGAIAKTPDDH